MRGVWGLRGWLPRQPVRRRRTLVLSGVGVLTVAGTALAVAGLTLVRHSTAGRFVDGAPDADEPGYQAYVVPTPTLAMVQRDTGGQLSGVALLALNSGDEGGSVVLFPPATLVGPAESATTLDAVYDDGGAEAVVASVADLLGVAVDEQLEVDDARWASLVEPVGAVELDVPEPTEDWPMGEATIAPDEVGAFLAALDDSDSDLARLERQQAFWDAWLGQVASDGSDALPGEADAGIGRFVRGLVDGSPTVVPLPVVLADDGDTPGLRLSGAQAGALVTDTVPFPRAPEQDRRIQVRLLNGTTDPDLTSTVARMLVAGGAEIRIVGNASSFDQEETRFLYGPADGRDKAIWLAAQLPGAVVERDPIAVEQGGSEDEIDVTVILGEDAQGMIGR
jgi:hypothetical protein